MVRLQCRAGSGFDSGLAEEMDERLGLGVFRGLTRRCARDSSCGRFGGYRDMACMKSSTFYDCRHRLVVRAI